MREFHERHLHIGLRTVKTGIAVALALVAAGLRDAAMPIFAAIGAISAMSRTLHDSRRVCATQFAGIIIGCAFAYAFVTVLPFYHDPAAIGVGLILLIAICNFLRLDYAVSLSCIVFVSICLTQEDVLWYAVNRFIDTTTGLVIAFLVNALIKPYNNRPAILRELDGFLAALPDILQQRIAAERYPDLEPLHIRLEQLNAELVIYEQQTFPNKKTRQKDSMYLRGCYQLAERILQELDAICMMDVPGTPAKHTIERLAARGIAVPHTGRQAKDADSQVMNYHLNNLLDAYSYLEEMRKD